MRMFYTNPTASADPNGGATPSRVKYWNVDVPVGPGAQGDDVRLIQYLLFSWTLERGTGDYDIDQVDGIWGVNTSACIRRFESYLDLVADGYVTPLAPTLPSTASGRVFKLEQLLLIYISRVNSSYWPAYQGRFEEMVSQAMYDMPDDGWCPEPLAGSLRSARF